MNDDGTEINAEMLIRCFSKIVNNFDEVLNVIKQVFSAGIHIIE